MSNGGPFAPCSNPQRRDHDERGPELYAADEGTRSSRRKSTQQLARERHDRFDSPYVDGWAQPKRK